MAQVTASSDFMGDRYKYDTDLCPSSRGWAQLDTRQDASYYGNWINPLTLELMSYAEGDVVYTRCDDEAEFISVARTCIEWHKEAGYLIGLDGMCRHEIIDAFTRMGLDEFLH